QLYAVTTRPSIQHTPAPAGGSAQTEVRYIAESARHEQLLSSATILKLLLDRLGFGQTPITSGDAVNFSKATGAIHDPVEGFLVDANGKRLGFTQATGVVTELPGSVYFGVADGFGYILG